MGRSGPKRLLIAHAAALAFVGLSMALQVPTLFRIGYARGRLMAYTPAFAVTGLAWLLQATDAQVPVQEAFERVPVAVIAGSAR